MQEVPILFRGMNGTWQLPDLIANYIRMVKKNSQR